jgi:hypothetical protein
MNRDEGCRLPRLIVVALAAITLAGCAGYTQVREITAAPDGFEGKEVWIKGKVGKITGLPGPQAYTLRDGTGEITVVTKEHLPALNSEVALKGVVKGAVVQGSTWTYDVRVEETERLR